MNTVLEFLCRVVKLHDSNTAGLIRFQTLGTPVTHTKQYILVYISQFSCKEAKGVQ